MSTQPSGLAYLWTYPGGLKMLEETLNVAVIVFLAIFGYGYKDYFLNTLVIIALGCTGVLIVLHVTGIIRKSKWPWHWIECIYVLVVAILLAISSTVEISELTRGYIVTGVTGYITSTIYFMDTLDKYQRAITPTPKYAWTTPNMPDLN